MSVDDRTMVFDTQSTVHEQNDIRFNRENNGFRLGVFNCNGHHAVTGNIELFDYQVSKKKSLANVFAGNILFVWFFRMKCMRVKLKIMQTNLKGAPIDYFNSVYTANHE